MEIVVNIPDWLSLLFVVLCMFLILTMLTSAILDSVNKRLDKKILELLIRNEKK